jgi:hypothetical protein
LPKYYNTLFAKPQEKIQSNPVIGFLFFVSLVFLKKEYIINTNLNKEVRLMKKNSSLIAFIMAVATLAAVAAVIVTHIDKICEFLESCRKTAEESCRLCCDSDIKSPSPAEEDGDFEDVEL